MTEFWVIKRCRPAFTEQGKDMLHQLAQVRIPGKHADTYKMQSKQIIIIIIILLINATNVPGFLCIRINITFAYEDLWPLLFS